MRIVVDGIIQYQRCFFQGTLVFNTVNSFMYENIGGGDHKTLRYSPSGLYNTLEDTMEELDPKSYKLLKRFMAIRLNQQTVMAVTELPQIAVCRISHSPFFFY